MKLTQETLPDYFSIADASTSWFTVPTNTFDFVNNNSKTLLVTIGDSWTWGSDVSINNGNNQYRRDNVYGHVLANSIGADWLNLALSAQGNFWIANMVKELAQIIPQLEYDRIYVVCTFTGVLRWFNTQFDQHIDYVSWFARNINSIEDIDRLLPMLNSMCVSNILRSLAPFNHVILRVGTNFVDPIGVDQLTAEQRIPLAWYQVMGCDDGNKIYTCTSYERISQGIEFIDPKKHTIFKQWIINKIDQSTHRLNALQDPTKFTNCHPLVDGHQQWAEYLLKYV